MKKKKVALLISFLFLFALPGMSFALTVSPDTTLGNPGSTISIPIMIDDVGAGINADAIGFTINFDESVLTFSNEVVKTGTVLESFSLISGQKIATGQVKVNGSLFGTPVSITSKGTLVYVKFTVNNTANKNSSISLTSFKDDIASATTTNSTFTITGIPAGTITFSTPNPSSIIANGTSTTSLTSLAIKDAANANVPDGTKISVSTTLGSLIAVSNSTAITQVTTTNGIISFRLQSGLATGDATITATSVSGNATGSTQVTLSPVPPTGFVVSNISDPTTAGTAETVIVKAVGAGGLTATGYTGTVHFTSSDAKATRPSDYKFVSGDGGVHTFTGGVTFQTKGEQSVTATDTTTSSITGSQTAITVNPAAATKISLAADKTTVASQGNGKANITATVQDDYGNTVSTNHSVTLTVTPNTKAGFSAGAASASFTTTSGSGSAELISKGTAVGTNGATEVVTATGSGLTNLADLTMKIVDFSAMVTDVDGSHPANPVLVTAETQPYTLTMAGMGGSGDSDYSWELKPKNAGAKGTLSKTTGTTITYTAPATLGSLTITTDEIVLKSQSQGLSYTVPVTVYPPVKFTKPTAAIGMTTSSSDNVTLTGGSQPYAYTSSGAGLAVSNSGALTATTKGSYTITAWDSTNGSASKSNGFRAVSPLIEVVEPLAISPSNKNIFVTINPTTAASPQTYTVTGGSGAGVTWTVNNAKAGTIDGTGKFTPKIVATGSEAAIIKAEDKKYPNITATLNVTVNGVLAINSPSSLTLASGGAVALTATGGSGTYAWSVKNPDGTISSAGGSTFTFIAPATGAFAGQYEISVSAGSSPVTITVDVPMVIDPKSLNFLSTGNAQPFTVTGLANGFGYSWTFLDTSKASVSSSAAAKLYGSFANTLTQSANNTFSPYTDVTNTQTFYVQVKVSGNSAQATNLKNSNLDTVVAGAYILVPVKTYEGKVQGVGNAPLPNAKVFVTNPSIFAGKNAVTDANGDFSLPLQISNASIVITFQVNASTYAPKVFTSTDLAKDKIIQLSKESVNGYFTGTVSMADGITPLLDSINVVAAYSSATGYTIEGVTKATPQTYRLDLTATASAKTYTLTATAPGYYTATAVSNPTANSPVTKDLKMVLQGNTLQEPAAGGAAPLTKIAGTSVNFSPVVVPAGAITPTNPTDKVTISWNLLPVTDATLKNSFGTAAVIVEMKDQGGNSVADPGELKLPVEITIPFDSSKILPGEFENGTKAVLWWTSKDLFEDSLKKGDKGTPVPASDIVLVMYLENSSIGLVTFRINHLSVFAAGFPPASTPSTPSTPGAPAAPAASSPGSDSVSSSNCFIATAAFGSPFEKHVVVLRQFRDAYLLPSSVGTTFVNTYYNISPPVAQFIANHDSLRALVRVALLPAVGMSYLAMNGTPLQFMIVMALGLAVFCGGFYLVHYRGQQRSRSKD